MVILSEALYYSSLAGLTTVFGSFLMLRFSFQPKTLSFAFGCSAGLMLFVAYVTLLPHTIKIGNIWHVMIGMLIAILLMNLIHHHPFSKVNKNEHDTEIGRIGFFLILATLAHNFPEGVAIGIGFEAEHHVGMALIIALSIHNIPEGMVLAIPLIAARKHPLTILGLSLLCGAALPLGTWFGATILHQSMDWTAISLAFASAILIWIVVSEVFPFAYRQGKQTAMIGLMIGTVFMYLVHLYHF